MIRNPDIKELKYFQLFWSGGFFGPEWKPALTTTIFSCFESGEIFSSVFATMFVVCDNVRQCSFKASD